MYQEMTGSCMETRNIIILLLCLVSAAVLVTGCTSQPSSAVTTVPNNNGSRSRNHPDFRHCHDYRNSRYNNDNGNSSVRQRPVCQRLLQELPRQHRPMTGVNKSGSKQGTLRLMFHGSRFLPVRRSLLSSKMKIVPHIMWLSIQPRL